MVETILTVSPEFMNDLPLEEQKKYFRLAAEFFEKEIGRENIIFAIVHMDEKTPHMHLCFVPLTSDGHLSAKKIIGDRQKLIYTTTSWRRNFLTWNAAGLPRKPVANTFQSGC